MKIRDVMNKYNITVEQFQRLRLGFLESEGYLDNGYECQSLLEYIDKVCKSRFQFDPPIEPNDGE